jgi:Fur family transcriptional regulator, ferric uptake regulator
MASVTEQSETWAERARRVLTENGHRSGQARKALVDLLDEQECARSVLEIEDRLRASGRPVARASIYRILDELERLRLVQKVQLGQEMARYEAVRTGAGHHHHLVCDSCGTVTPFSDDGLEDAIRKLSRRVPMRVSEHEIILHGDCGACAPS